MLTQFYRCCARLVLLLLTAQAAYGQGPAEQVKIPLNLQGEQTTLDMRYVAGGELSKNPPQAAAQQTPEDVGGLGKYRVTPFYLARTELTFQQLRAILPAEVVQRISGRIQRTTGKDSSQEYLRKAVQSPSYPAFSISLKEAVQVCTTLTELMRLDQGNAAGAATIEARRFRLPPHAEWQFACRAALTDDEVQSLPHVNAWTDLDALDKNARAMLLEEWEKPAGPSTTFKERNSKSST
jgi:formylglycine-generating enzyme required for sulfatase activity